MKYGLLIILAIVLEGFSNCGWYQDEKLIDCNTIVNSCAEGPCGENLTTQADLAVLNTTPWSLDEVNIRFQTGSLNIIDWNRSTFYSCWSPLDVLPAIESVSVNSGARNWDILMADIFTDSALVMSGDYTLTIIAIDSTQLQAHLMNYIPCDDTPCYPQ